jgi:hypothetical protein
MKTTIYTLNNYKNIPQMKFLSTHQVEAIEIVGRVFPFKIDSLIVDEVIDWRNIHNDPMFIITFPQKAMLNEEHYRAMKIILDHGGDALSMNRMADMIRNELDPEKKGSKVLEVQACVNQHRQAY